VNVEDYQGQCIFVCLDHSQSSQRSMRPSPCEQGLHGGRICLAETSCSNVKESAKLDRSIRSAGREIILIEQIAKRSGRCQVHMRQLPDNEGHLSRCPNWQERSRPDRGNYLRWKTCPNYHCCHEQARTSMKVNGGFSGIGSRIKSVE